MGGVGQAEVVLGLTQITKDLAAALIFESRTLQELLAQGSDTAVPHFSRTRLPLHEHAAPTSAEEGGAASVSGNAAGSIVSAAGYRRARDGCQDFTTHVTVRPENDNRNQDFQVAVCWWVGWWVGGWRVGG